MSRHIHHETRMWVVSARDADGRENHRTNVSSFIGTDRYDEVCRVLRGGLKPGHTLDSSEADAQHRRLCEARVRYDAAMDRFLRAAVGDGDAPHPGSLADYMPD